MDGDIGLPFAFRVRCVFFSFLFIGSELVFAVLSGCWQALAVREFPRVLPTVREAQAGEAGPGWDSVLHGERRGLEDPVSVDYGVTYRGRCFVGERCAVGSVRARRLHARRLISFVSSFHAGRAFDGTVFYERFCVQNILRSSKFYRLRLCPNILTSLLVVISRSVPAWG